MVGIITLVIVACGALLLIYEALNKKFKFDAKPNSKADKISAWILLVCIILPIFFAGWGIAKIFINTQEEQSASSLEADMLAWKARGQRVLKTALKDPESAQFQNVYYIDKNGMPVICGQVNSKNSFGAYTGFENFIVYAEAVILMQSVDNDFQDKWREFCT